MGSTRTTLLPTLVAAAAALLLAPAHARAAEAGVVPDITWGASAAEQEQTARLMGDLRAPWARLNVSWSDVEPSRGSYSPWWLDHLDRGIALTRASGARVLLMVHRSPQWASGSANPESPPLDPADYARFLQFLASRYGASVDAYEVWNEENYTRFWPGGPDASEYVGLLKAAYPVLKAVDPSAQVVFGGLLTNAHGFLEEAYAAGAKGHFDVLGVHPYTWCNPPASVERGPDGRIKDDYLLGYRELRSSMLANGDDKPIWFTEFGWSTTSEQCGVSEERQAEWLTETLRLVEQDPYVQVALWYNLRNNYWDRDADTYETRFGLVRTDFSPKPAYHALKAYIAGAGAPPSPTSTPRTRTSATVRVSRPQRTARAARRGPLTERTRPVRVEGRVSGVSRGRVTLRIQRLDRRRRAWRNLRPRRVRIRHDGRFARRVRPRAGARLRVRAVYAGNPRHGRSRSRYAYFRA